MQLLQTHPAMKAVVAREIISLIFKFPTTTASAAAFDPPKGTGKHIRFPDETESPNPKSKTPLPPTKKINGNAHARYYSMITLNQIVLTLSDRAVARQLLDVYFEVFKEVLGESNDDEDDKNSREDEKNTATMDKSGRVIDGGRKGKKKKRKEHRRGDIKHDEGFTEVEDTNAKLIAATLTGVNRAMPFAKVNAADAK